MLTELEVKELINRKSETKNLDYKETINWQAAKDEKLELVKDVLAMANTQDGGRVVFGVEDKTYAFVGMPDADWQSFDQTKVNDLVQKFGGPCLFCQVYKHLIDGKRVVCIDVPEFDREPVICMLDANSSHDPAKLILAKGAIYLRTQKATSEVIRSAEDMRNLLGRALLKKGDEILRNIEQLMKGKPPVVEEESRVKYTREINDPYFDQLYQGFGDFGYWQVITYPVTYVSRRIPQISEVGKLVQECEVYLRGWNFPHTDRTNTSNFSEGRQSHTSWERHIEGYRAYRSGLFMWQGVLWEDAANYSTGDGRRMLAFPSVIYDVTEFLLFSKRYYERLNPDAVNIRISLKRTHERQLVSSGPILIGAYVCREPSITAQEIVKTSDLRASYDEVARRFLKHLLALFNWDDPPDEMLQEWQQKLLERRV